MPGRQRSLLTEAHHRLGRGAATSDAMCDEAYERRSPGDSEDDERQEPRIGAEPERHDRGGADRQQDRADGGDVSGDARSSLQAVAGRLVRAGGRCGGGGRNAHGGDSS